MLVINQCVIAVVHYPGAPICVLVMVRWYIWIQLGTLKGPTAL